MMWEQHTHTLSKQITVSFTCMKTSVHRTLTVFLVFPYSLYEYTWENNNSCVFLNTCRQTVVFGRGGRTPWFSTGNVTACKHKSHWEDNNGFVLLCTAEQEAITKINLVQTHQKCFCFFSFRSAVIFTADMREYSCTEFHGMQSALDIYIINIYNYKYLCSKYLLVSFFNLFYFKLCLNIFHHSLFCL